MKAANQIIIMEVVLALTEMDPNKPQQMERNYLQSKEPLYLQTENQKEMAIFQKMAIVQETIVPSNNQKLSLSLEAQNQEPDPRATSKERYAMEEVCLQKQRSRVGDSQICLELNQTHLTTQFYLQAKGNDSEATGEENYAMQQNGLQPERIRLLLLFLLYLEDRV